MGNRDRKGFYLTEVEISMMKSGDWEGLEAHHRELERKWAADARFNSMGFALVLALCVGSFFYIIEATNIGKPKSLLQRIPVSVQGCKIWTI